MGKGRSCRGRGRGRWGSPWAPWSAGRRDRAGAWSEKLVGISLEVAGVRVAAQGWKAVRLPGTGWCPAPERETSGPKALTRSALVPVTLPLAGLRVSLRFAPWRKQG